ncbi:Protein YIM1 [Wickerhamiella sorbophila]|uniref:Protein YIM1 n=1 Tax=Wickerhamiella sorbophila TaxID=45607 RepID=A0A2T0FED4_9ASCO|nr:Protein YIM1 [Wickerhamiella sorbophila]PRT53319.1 Protein YIM1 [Wickerhamiella sorbophila]
MGVNSKIIHSSATAHLSLAEKPIPIPPSPDCVVVESYAIAVNPVDVKVFAKLPFGVPLGSDYAGVVRHIGSDVQNFSVGDRVSGCLTTIPGSRFVGSYSVVNVKKDAIGVIPQQFSPIEAAAAPVTLGTAWRLTKYAEVRPDSRVLVLGGATSVGTFVIQLLKQKYNVAEVVATCSSKSSEYVKSFGADRTIDYNGDLRASLLESVKDGKYTSIIDTVGDGPVGWIANKLVEKPKSKYNFLSCAGTAPPGDSYGMLHLLTSLPRISGRTMFGRLWGIKYSMVAVGREDWTETLKFLDTGADIKVPVDSVTPYNEALKAVERLKNVGARGKLVIEF